MTIRPAHRLILLVFLPFVTISWGWVGEPLIADRTACDYYLPKGFVGWATIHYGVRGAPETPHRDGRYAYRFPANGVINTSTPFESGTAHDRYFYYSKGSSLRELPETRWVWAAAVGGPMDEHGHQLSLRETFFIGTEKQYFQAVHDPRGDD